MKLLAAVLIGLTLAFGAGAALAAGSGNALTFTPDNLHWVAGTGASKGLFLTTFVGDPNKSGNAITRVKMPDGYTNKPHYHAHDEYITVIQGTLLFGTGDVVNKASAKVLPTGSFIMVPAGVHHWSIAQGDTIEQVGGQGPQTNIPVKTAM